jgi:hypothetical protein
MSLRGKETNKKVCQNTFKSRMRGFVFCLAIPLFASSGISANAQEVLGPVVREAIKKIEKETRKIDEARRRHKENMVPLENKKKELEQQLSQTQKKSPEQSGRTEAEYLEVAVRLNNYDMTLAKQTIESLEGIAPAISRLQETLRTKGGTGGVEESVIKTRRMVKGLLQVGSRILVSAQVSSKKSAKLRQVENTLLVMQRVYRRVLNPKAQASLAVQLDTMVHAISATYSQTQSLVDLLQDERARLAIANNIALSRLLALKMARLGGEVRGVEVGLEDTALRITERGQKLDEMISRDAGVDQPRKAYQPGRRLREMANSNVF